MKEVCCRLTLSLSKLANGPMPMPNGQNGRGLGLSSSERIKDHKQQKRIN
jgi:hypothetical protein